MEKQMTASNFNNNAWRKALLAAGLAAGLLAAAGAYADPDSSNPQPHSDGIGATISDTAITAKVKSQLTGNQLKNSNISVTTTNGVVTLTGMATTSDAKSYAEAQAKGVDGVKSVDDELTTPSSSHAVASTKRVVSDSWITTKVKSDILADSVSKGFDVSVKTKHGVVMLSGTLANDDAVAHVKDIASQVKGVKSVDASMLKSSS
jgi:hyperosmotically inducible periplasmic protein